MPIAFECEYCARPIRVADSLANRRIRCPGCSEVITVPDESEPLDAIEISESPKPTRRSRRPFEEELKQIHSPTPRAKSLTLDNSSQASNPGQINVNIFKYWSSYPTWPTIWLGSTILFSLVGLIWKPALAGAAVSGILMILYWIRVREHFRHGCVVPAIVLSVDKQLVAFCTDLTTGDGNYPAVKILKQPLLKMTGGPPKKNQRLVAVALYEPSPTQNDHWATFHPKVVNCVTNNTAAIRHAFESIEESDWQELIDYLERIPRKTVGLHELW